MVFLVAAIALIIVAVVFQSIRKKPATPIGKIGGTGAFQFDIVGESHYQDALEILCGGRTEESAAKRAEAHLILEDNNPHDKLAVRVDISGKTVGYLASENARQYREKIAQAGQPRLIGVCDALIVGGWRRSKTDVGSFGVRLDLPIA
ncbi:hypothetical protein [Rhodanobacter sp. L36]|uniref:hypothetical protein n=1 Tax=Rhodanobacter sp. L36 TaxID=1747221 RepID=UPI00131CA23E|nr:hypothetical protein [Rhodanobacter sp. L36]